MPLTLIFTQPGNFTIDDDGIPGNNTSVIRDGNGAVIFTFLHPADALTFRVSTPGVNLTVNFTDSMGGADFTIGSLDPDPLIGPAQTPDSVVIRSLRTTANVTLVSNGSITEGGADPSADIIAGSLTMSAVTGIGSALNALETQTGLLEAETVTGGINLGNFGSVQIGGLNDFVNGLDVLTSGNLNFTTIGSIFLSEIDLDPGNPPASALQTIHGGNVSGDVTINANGVLSDIITNTDLDAISVPRGNITLTSGRDVAFGTIGVDFDNDVRASGTVTINAGRDFLIDGFADLASDDFFQNTGGNVVLNTVRNVQLRNIAGSDAGVTASGSAGGDVIVTTGFGGALILDAPTPTALSSSSGDIIVNADRVLISAISGMNAVAGQVTLTPATPGREIILGSAGDAAAAMELSDAELDRVFTKLLNIGAYTAGDVRIIAPITLTAGGGPPDLIIRSATSIRFESNLTVTDELALSSLDDVFQTAASTITAASIAVSVDVFNTDPGFGGFGVMNGTISGANTISGNGDADTLTGTNGVNNLFGLGGDDAIGAAGGNDILDGGGGNDILDGGAGADAMSGGIGDDTYFVDNVGDTYLETAGQGLDRVLTSVNLTLAAGNSIETLQAVDLGAVTPINLAGNEFANSIYGNAGPNTLNGGGGGDYLVGLAGSDVLDGNAGADAMDGGSGDDTYTVDNTGDFIAEGIGAGTDTVRSSISYVLTPGAFIEVLLTTNTAGTGAIDLTGNEFGNSIYGNAGANVLSGGGGADYLVGLGGNDFLDGNAGADAMEGGAGDDTYVVDTAGDVLAESAANGVDTVTSSINYALAAGVEVEVLLTTNTAGTGTIDLTGNNFAQNIYGNAGINWLSGGGGADYLVGLAGNDRLDGEAGGDALDGGAANDRLDGGIGNDAMLGGAGNDDFVFATALNAVTNVDSIFDMTVGQDRILLENAVFTTLAAGALPASAFRTGSAAGDADDRIIYDPATGALFYDQDGNAGGFLQVQFALLSTGLALGASDFQVI